ncbi:MAG: transposase domain-containing protein [Bacteroidota bacterium]
MAIDRKIYLFACSHDAVKNAAIIYSLPGTCKINDTDPCQWIKNTLNRIPIHPKEKLHE